MFIIIYTIILGRIACDALSSDCAALVRLPLFRFRPGLDAFVIGCRCVIRPSGDPPTDYRTIFFLVSFSLFLSFRSFRQNGRKPVSPAGKYGAGDANCSLGAWNDHFRPQCERWALRIRLETRIMNSVVAGSTRTHGDCDSSAFLLRIKLLSLAWAWVIIIW